MWMRPMIAAVLGLAAGYVLRGSQPAALPHREVADGSPRVEAPPIASSGAQQHVAEAPRHPHDQRPSRADAPVAAAHVISAQEAKNTAELNAQLQALRISHEEAK